MICDRIGNADLYRGLGPRMVRAFDFVRGEGLSRLAPGRYDIGGDALFAMVDEYETKERADCELEGHRRYIDLQYMVAGSECIGYAPLGDQPPSLRYPPEEDCLFYQGDASLFLLEQGMFAIFFPTDLHMPCIRAGHRRVRKVVVKIRV